METKLKLFNQKSVRTVWNAEEEEWYFSVVDVIAVLTESKNPRSYWKVLKNRLSKEGSEVVTFCNQLKMQASDGKYYPTDALTTKGVLRLVRNWKSIQKTTVFPNEGNTVKITKGIFRNLRINF